MIVETLIESFCQALPKLFHSVKFDAFAVVVVVVDVVVGVVGVDRG